MLWQPSLPDQYHALSEDQLNELITSELLG